MTRPVDTLITAASIATVIVALAGCVIAKSKRAAGGAAVMPTSCGAEPPAIGRIMIGVIE